MLKNNIERATVARTEKVRGHSLGAKVSLYADGNLYDFLKSVEADLETVFIVSYAEVGELKDAEDAVQSEDFENLKISVKPADGEKCERCWMIKESVGKDSEHPQLCARCVEALK